MANNQKQELGALWKRVSKNSGNAFYTGNIRTPGGEFIEIIAFDNDRKEKDTHPDIRIYVSDNQGPRGGGYQGGNNYNNNRSNNNYQRPQNSYSRNNNAAPVQKKEDPMDKVEYPHEEIDPDDIPF